MFLNQFPILIYLFHNFHCYAGHSLAIEDIRKKVCQELKTEYNIINSIIGLLEEYDIFVRLSRIKCR